MSFFVITRIKIIGIAEGILGNGFGFCRFFSDYLTQPAPQDIATDPYGATNKMLN